MGTSESYLSTELWPRPEEQFLSLGQQFVEEWGKVGVPLTLSISKDLENFRKASFKAQYRAICYLDFNVSILKEMSASGENPRNTKMYLWRALKKLRLVPPADFMEVIDDDDVVEIYYNDEMQIFRNFRFLEVVSTTIEDLLCKPWFDLSKRHWKTTLAMFRIILQFKLGFIRNTRSWNVPEHEILELNSLEDRKIALTLKYIVPLAHNGKFVALISTNRSRILSRRQGAPIGQ